MTDHPTILLREAAQADLPAILSLLAQPELDDGCVLDLASARAVLARMQSYPSYRLIVAEQSDTIVGSYALLVMDNLGHKGARSAIVEQVMVAPHAQGSGVGRAMMHHAMDCASEAGCYKLVLSSNIKRTRAHAFYDGLGFERHGVSFLVHLGGRTAP